MNIEWGNGNWHYEAVPGWDKLPDGWAYRDVAGVAVDSKDQVYVFNRGRHPVIVFDRDGNFVRSFGEDQFRRAHGIDIGPDDSIYLTDDDLQCVHKFSASGKLVLTIGIPGKKAAVLSGDPFCGCTHTALSPTGEIYVSDGYHNARVHKFAPDGRHLLSWGGAGTDPGEFNIVHNIVTDEAGWVYVADRENHRIQVFDANGRYETQWNNLHRPCGLYRERRNSEVFYIGELGPQMSVNAHWTNLGPRVSICDRHGKRVSRLGGDRAGELPGQFVAPHSLATDARGDLYVGEVANTFSNFNGWLAANPREIRCLQKFRRIEAAQT